MAEASLNRNESAIRDRISRYLSFGTSAPGSGDQGSDIDMVLIEGLLQFYTPPPIRGETWSHVWSFLMPTTTIGIFTAPSGTLASDPNGGTTIDINETTGFFPDDAGTGAELVGQTFTLTDVSAGTTETGTVASVTDANTIEASANVSGNFASTSDTISIALDGNYDLPENFGGLEGDLTYNTQTALPPIQITSQQRIRQFRQDSTSITTGRPEYAAVRPRSVQGTTSASSRFELMLWPTPSAAYTLHYTYNILLDNLSTDHYPAGTQNHIDTIMASCLARAELLLSPMEGRRVWHETFMERLAASVHQDRRLMHGDHLGQNLDGGLTPRSLRSGRDNSVTFGGVQYP